MPTRMKPKHLIAQQSSYMAQGRGEVHADTTALMDPPDWIHPEARARFATVVRWLRGMRILADGDANVVLRYSLAWHRWSVAERQLAKNDDAVQYDAVATRYGEKVQPTPALKQSQDAAAEMSRLEKLLGLTPTDRIALGVNAIHSADADEVERVLSKRFA